MTAGGPSRPLRWRRKIESGGAWWAQARDGSWSRWDELVNDWVRQPGGPPEPVPPLSSEGGTIYEPPARGPLADAEGAARVGWDFMKTFLAIALPAVLALAVAAAAIGAFALIWNLLFVPWLGGPVRLGNLIVVMISASLAVSFFLAAGITVVRAVGTVGSVLLAAGIVTGGTIATLYVVARSRGIGIIELMSRRETIATTLMILLAWGGLSLRRWIRSE